MVIYQRIIQEVEKKYNSKGGYSLYSCGGCKEMFASRCKKGYTMLDPETNIPLFMPVIAQYNYAQDTINKLIPIEILEKFYFASVDKDIANCRKGVPLY